MKFFKSETSCINLRYVIAITLKKNSIIFETMPSATFVWNYANSRIAAQEYEKITNNLPELDEDIYEKT